MWEGRVPYRNLTKLASFFKKESICIRYFAARLGKAREKAGSSRRLCGQLVEVKNDSNKTSGIQIQLNKRTFYLCFMGKNSKLLVFLSPGGKKEKKHYTPLSLRAPLWGGTLSVLYRISNKNKTSGIQIQLNKRTFYLCFMGKNSKLLATILRVIYHRANPTLEVCCGREGFHIET